MPSTTKERQKESFSCAVLSSQNLLEPTGVIEFGQTANLNPTCPSNPCNETLSFHRVNRPRLVSHIPGSEIVNRGPQRVQGYTGTEGAEVQRNSGYRGTVGTEGTEEQRVQRYRGYRGTVGTEEQWVKRNRGYRGTEEDISTICHSFSFCHS